jgi:hypothetical protein
MVKIIRKTDQKITNPGSTAIGYESCISSKKMTKRPMTVLVDEALCLYLSTFATLPEYKQYQPKGILGMQEA